MEENMALTTAQIELIRDSFDCLKPDMEAAYDDLAQKLVLLAG